jgi:hypothetical protein
MFQRDMSNVFKICSTVKSHIKFSHTFCSYDIVILSRDGNNIYSTKNFKYEDLFDNLKKLIIADYTKPNIFKENRGEIETYISNNFFKVWSSIKVVVHHDKTFTEITFEFDKNKELKSANFRYSDF